KLLKHHELFRIVTKLDLRLVEIDAIIADAYLDLVQLVDATVDAQGHLPFGHVHGLRVQFVPARVFRISTARKLAIDADHGFAAIARARCPVGQFDLANVAALTGEIDGQPVAFANEAVDTEILAIAVDVDDADR